MTVAAIMKSFLRDRRGVAALLFALIAPVFISSAGIAVDLAQAYNVKTRLGNALDKTALAAGTLRGDDATVEQAASNFFYANYPADRLGEVSSFDVDIGDRTITVSATARVDNAFMRIFGEDYFDVAAATEVTKAFWNDVEIALILDVSGSMAGTKVEDLKDAAVDLVNIIVPAEPQGDTYSKIALVPYGMAVNVGSYAPQVRGSILSGTSTTPGSANYRFTNAQGNSRTLPITTCVSERTGVEAYTDVSPSTARVGRVYAGTGNPCGASQILPLTDDKDILTAQINALAASGSTGGQVGVAWGWYMLSPNFGYLWPEASRPADYGGENLYKIAVLMTDGEYNSPYCRGVIAADATTGSGSAADHINCNATNGNSYAQAEALCDAMKDEGIIVYTIGFQIVNAAAATDLMENCATDASHFYLADDGDELRETFRDIARKISSLYISQ